MDLTKSFNKGDVAISEWNGSEKTIKTFTITDCLFEKRVAKSGETYNHLVFKLKYDDNKTTEASQIFNLTDKQSNPVTRLNLAIPGNWYNGRGYAPTLTYEISQAIKAKMGEKLYNDRKDANGGLNRPFFKDCVFDFEVNEGISKAGKPYMILQTKRNLLDFLADKGLEPRSELDFKKFLGIEQADLIKEVEKALDIDPNDLPF
jgi:hypothetical protein